MDVAIKSEMFLYDLSSMLFWISLLEIGVYIFSLLIFLTSPSELGFVWFNISHVVRGIIGFKLIKNIPYSY